MDDAHKELVKRLNQWVDGLPSGILLMREAAGALEAMAGEVGSLKQAVEAEIDERARMDFHHMHALADLAAERDRLKAALQAIEQGDYYGCVSEFALKALGGDA